MSTVIDVLDQTVTVNVRESPTVTIDVETDGDDLLGGAPYTWGQLRYSHLTWGQLKSRKWGELR